MYITRKVTVYDNTFAKIDLERGVNEAVHVTTYHKLGPRLGLDKANEMSEKDGETYTFIRSEKKEIKYRMPIEFFVENAEECEDQETENN